MEQHETEERCVACGSPDVVVFGTSTLHRIAYAACEEHKDEGYEHAVAEHQPCTCGNDDSAREGRPLNDREPIPGQQGDCGEHPGCTCPMTGDSPAWHYDDCASHDPSIRHPT